MLMGVLVIAFPVSVFSDLWSHELKQVQGFESLNEESDENQQQPAAGGNTGGSDPSPVVKNHRAQRLYPSTMDSDGAVLMDKQDLRGIVECVYNIRENERQLKAILRKYTNGDNQLLS
jgi:hypothetical protein